jgi:hypothetical protein
MCFVRGFITFRLLRKCFLKQATEGNIEGKTEGTGRQGIRRKQLLHYLMEMERCFKLKEEALARAL